MTESFGSERRQIGPAVAIEIVDQKLVGELGLHRAGERVVRKRVKRVAAIDEDFAFEYDGRVQHSWALAAGEDLPSVSNNIIRIAAGKEKTKLCGFVRRSEKSGSNLQRVHHGALKEENKRLTKIDVFLRRKKRSNSYCR